MTQQQVADILNIDRSTYAYYETGKTKPDVDMLLRISHIYDVSLDSLVGNQSELNNAMPDSETVSTEDKDGKTSFINLTGEEKNAVLLFRLCDNKGEAMRVLKELSADYKTE